MSLKVGSLNQVLFSLHSIKCLSYIQSIQQEGLFDSYNEVHRYKKKFISDNYF